MSESLPATNNTRKIPKSRVIGKNGIYYNSHDPERDKFRRSFSFKIKYPEIFEKVHQDYLTGQHNSASLAEKYGLRQGSVFGYIRYYGWFKELKSKGITMPKEPPTGEIQFDPALLAALERDFINDMTLEDMARKHDIAPSTISKLSKRHGWVNSRIKAQLTGKHGKPITKAEMLRRRIDVMDHITYKFINDCFEQFQILLASVQPYSKTNQAIDIKTLKILVKDFDHLYATLRKIKADLRKGLPVSSCEKIKLGNPVLMPLGEDGEEQEQPLASQKAPVRKMSEIRQP